MRLAGLLCGTPRGSCICFPPDAALHLVPTQHRLSVGDTWHCLRAYACGQDEKQGRCKPCFYVLQHAGDRSGRL